MSRQLPGSIEDWRFQMPQTEIRYRGPTRLYVFCKPYLMQRILDNLLGNACRYAEQVDVRLQADQKCWTLIISDNGPGVSDEQLEHLFEPFYRADTARAHDGNFGLGLAITQAAAQAQDIRISARHAESGGLEVVLTGWINKSPAE